MTATGPSQLSFTRSSGIARTYVTAVWEDSGREGGAMTRFQRWCGLGAAVALAVPLSSAGAQLQPAGDPILGMLGCAVLWNAPDEPGDPIISSSDASFNGDSFGPTSTRPATGARLSDSNRSGQNADGNTELSLFRQSPTAIVPQQGQTIQATQTTGDNGFGPPAMSDPAGNSKGAVVLSATFDPFGTNADHSTELFQFERLGNGTITGFQLTATTGGTGVLHPAVNDSITRVAVPWNLNFGENPSGRPQLYVLDNTPSGGIEQVTANDGSFPITDVTLNDAGTAGTFVSTGNLTGANADHSAEAFRFFENGNQWGLQQFTNGTFEVRDVVISGNGNYAAFTANADLAGDNPGDLRVLFRHALQTGGVQQVTSPGLEVSLPDIDATGNRITYLGDGDPLGFNPDGNREAWVWDARGPRLAQVTRSTDGEIDRPSMNDQGTMLAFTSTADLLGSNPDGSSELFFATCGPRTRLFSDVGLTHAGFEPIGGVASAGVLAGFANGTFRPTATVTRGQLGTAIYNAAGRPAFTVGPRVFLDVPGSNANYRGIQFLHRELGIGGQGSNFRPNDPASRRETAKWINFFWDEHSPPACTTPIFSDVPADNPFCRFVEELARRGVVGEGGRFRPTAPVNRQTAADWLIDAMAVR
jgi:hypothetical protein